MDIDAGRNRSHAIKGVSPCLTRSRYRGHWISTLRRRFTLDEMFRLQGMDPDYLAFVIPGAELGKQIGNAPA